MKNPSNIHLQRLATMLLTWLLLLACSLFPFGIRSSTTTSETATNQPADAATQSSDHILGTAVPTDSPAGQTGATAMPTEGTVTTGSGSLAIHDSYPLDVANGVMGLSLTTSPGKVWVGTGRGTIEKVDSQSGAFEQSISLAGTKIDLESLTSDHIVGAVIKLGFDGQYIAATMILK